MEKRKHTAPGVKVHMGGGEWLICPFRERELALRFCGREVWFPLMYHHWAYVHFSLPPSLSSQSLFVDISISDPALCGDISLHSCVFCCIWRCHYGRSSFSIYSTLSGEYNSPPQAHLEFCHLDHSLLYYTPIASSKPLDGQICIRVVKINLFVLVKRVLIRCGSTHV